MRQQTANSCNSILQRAGLPILERAQKLSRLEHVVRQLLPAELAAHCRVLNLRSEILVLSTTSSAWAARLRFAAPELRMQLKCQYALKVRTIELRVQPETPENQSVTRPPAKLSLHTGDLLVKTARTLNHPGLQEALYRLAANARDY